eukprot:TRINITY_DN27851_c0_g1_i2.p1 TRINITY_DN27851_c0_g1~~TRINITY_DN27851_c0_g1_i2.p1  ORF type:complete len:282 (+),score=31.66 TRINITY_DN27851_c0_g1_i2:782-1627(+)
MYVEFANFSWNTVTELCCSLFGGGEKSFESAPYASSITFKKAYLSIATGNGQVGPVAVESGVCVFCKVSCDFGNVSGLLHLSKDSVELRGLFDGDLSFDHITLKNVALMLKIGGSTPTFSLKGNATFFGVSIEASVARVKAGCGGTSTVVYGIVDKPGAFKLSDICPILRGQYADNLGFTKVGFCWASSKPSVAMDGFPFPIDKGGIQVFAETMPIPALESLLPGCGSFILSLESSVVSSTGPIGGGIRFRLSSSKSLAIKPSDHVTCDPYSALIPLLGYW